MAYSIEGWNSVETCPCGICLEWRKDVERVCEKLGLDSKKLTKDEKIALRYTFVRLGECHRDHNWKIMEPRFAHARIGMREERE
jgi:hypothetical protein